MLSKTSLKQLSGTVILACALAIGGVGLWNREGVAAEGDMDEIDGVALQQRVENCFQEAEGFQARLTHEVISKLNKTHTPLEGRIRVSKKGLFKLTYFPDEQSGILFDGKKIRAWDTSAQFRVDADSTADAIFSSLVDLFGSPSSMLTERFSVRRLNGKKNTPELSPSQPFEVWELTPRFFQSLVQKWIVTTGPCPAVRRLMVVDMAGNLIRLTFDDIVLIPHFENADFQLRIPGNSQIVRP